MDCYEVELTFTEPLLGTVSLDEELYRNYIASKAPGDTEDELATLDIAEEMEKGTTGFHRLDGQPILYNYVIKGFMKDACSMLRRVKGTGSKGIRAYRKIIDGLVFVEPRRIPIDVNGEIGILERPLRAQTAQGERIALARSETVPVGSTIKFKLLVLGEVSEELLTEWFTYGALRGLGQWRNAGYGQFTYELTKT